MITYKRPTPYIIKGRPVKVYKSPTTESAVINALPPETKIVAVGEENSYIQLFDSGGFIFKGNNIVLDKQMIARTLVEEKVQKRTIRNSIQQTKEMPMANTLEGKQLRIADGVTTDLYGNPIQTSDQGKGYLSYYKTADDGGIIVRNKTTGATYKLDASNLNVITSEVQSYSEEASTTLVPASSFLNQQIAENSSSSTTTNTENNSPQLSTSTWSKIASTGISLAGQLQNIIGYNHDADKSIFQVQNTRSVFGMPYQFEPTVDNRLNGGFERKDFGRKFAQKIVSRAPVLIMQAGVPDFLKGFSDNDQQSVMGELMGILGGENTSDKVAKQAGKYYAFKESSVEYFRAVNDMCHATASMMGIGNRSIDVNGQQGNLSAFDWSAAASGDGGSHNLWGYYRQAVAFYVSADPQMQDGFANGSRQSQLAGKVNQISDQAAELQFILGTVGTVDPTGLAKGAHDKMQEGAANNSEGASDTGVIGTLIDKIDTLMSGGKLIFPEIWSDSSYTKNYNVTIKLDSPDCDPVSIYLNIIVPLCHILGFCMPRWSGANAYVSPFIVRAYLRSMFHVDMGIITSCDITRGTQQGWTQDGLPTEITVQLTIKDLYNVLSMIVSEKLDDIIANPAQLDFLGNLCGINIAVPDFQRTLALWVACRNPVSGISNATSRLQSRMAGAINNRWQNILNSFWRM